MSDKHNPNMSWFYPALDTDQRNYGNSLDTNIFNCGQDTAQGSHAHTQHGAGSGSGSAETPQNIKDLFAQVKAEEEAKR
jgi:hypothetical protein